MAAAPDFSSLTSNLAQIEIAQTNGWSHFISGRHGTVTAVKVPSERDKTAWADVIRIVGNQLQEYERQYGAEGTASLRERFLTNIPPEHAALANQQCTTASVSSRIAQFQNDDVIPTSPPPSCAASHCYATLPRLTSHSSAVPSASPYPIVNIFLEANGSPLYGEPDSYDLRLESTSSRDVCRTYPEACIFIMEYLRSERDKPSADPRRGEETKRLGQAVAQVAQKGVHVFLETLKTFRAEFDSLPPDTLNQRLAQYCLSLKSLALAINPPTLGEGEHPAQIKELELELVRANYILQHVEQYSSVSPSRLDAVALAACETRRQCLEVPKHIQKEWDLLMLEIETTDFTTRTVGLGSFNIDKKFISLRDRIGEFDKEIHKQRQGKNLSNIGAQQCLDKAPALRQRLADRIEPYQNNLSEEGKKKFNSFKETFIVQSVRGRAFTALERKQ